MGTRGKEGWRRKQGPCHCVSPGCLQTALQARGCKFHLACMVFSHSILRIHIILTSYLHYIGFHEHNSYKMPFAPLLSSVWKSFSDREGDCKVMGRILMRGKRADLRSHCSYRNLPGGKKRGWLNPLDAAHLASCLSTTKYRRPYLKKKKTLLILQGLPFQ